MAMGEMALAMRGVKSAGRMQLERLTRKKCEIYDELMNACRDGKEWRINYVSELERLTSKIDQLEWEIKNGYRH